MEKGSKKTWDADIIGHWNKPFDGIQVAPQDFYRAVEEAIARRQVPQIFVSRVQWKEGNLLSASREYLRVECRRYVYDICAAPVGTGCFFSSWLCLRKLKLTLPHIVGMALSIFCLFHFWRTFIAPIVQCLILLYLASNLAEGNINVRPELEEFLHGLTIIGPPLGIFFPRITYFQMDTASMLLGVVQSAFLEAIDGFTKDKGIPRLTDEERKPMMRDFWKK